MDSVIFHPLVDGCLVGHGVAQHEEKSNEEGSFV